MEKIGERERLKRIAKIIENFWVKCRIAFKYRIYNLVWARLENGRQVDIVVYQCQKQKLEILGL